LARQAHHAVHATARSDKSVLDGIINSDAIPESDKTVDRITQEARTLVGAGTETTGASLDTIVYHVLANPRVYQRLKAELTESAQRHSDMVEPLVKYEVLQQLPYLTGVINEGLRLSNSVSGRLARVSPRDTYTYKSYVLPPGTTIGMSLKNNHVAETIYPEPLKFNPERWLVKGEELKKLEKYFVPFSRGSRSCIGKELALMNLYMMVANFFHKFDAELYQTGQQDLAMEHDFFAPFPASESKGLRVMLI
jgi:cytochrome P450